MEVHSAKRIQIRFAIAIAILLAGWTVSSAKAKQAAPPPKAAGPAISFSAHGIFEGIHSTDSQGGGQGSPKLRKEHISLPAGDYWIYADYVARGDQQNCGAYFALLGADGMPRTGDILSSLDGKYGRAAQLLRLASPFSGDTSYGGGAFGPEEIWFRIVPAKEQAFLPFGFGAIPKPLKKGIEGVHGTLLKGFGDYYYTQIPVGYWRFIFKILNAPPSTLPAGSATNWGANVYFLDERGVAVPNQTLYVLPLAGRPGSTGTEKVIKVDAPEFIKLHAAEFSISSGGPKKPPRPIPLKYSLTIEKADASEYQPPPAGS